MNRSRRLSRPSWHRIRSLTSKSGLSLSRKLHQPLSRSQQLLRKSERLKPPSSVGRFPLSILRDPRDPAERLRKYNWRSISDEVKQMLTLPMVSCVEEVSASRGVNANGQTSTIRCYTYPVITTWPPKPLPPDRELAAQAMTHLMRIESEVREARADWNQDRFRRLMRLRPRAVARLRRRWERLNPSPRIPLGSLRRRYHANLSRYLHESNP